MRACAAAPFAPGASLACDARWQAHDLVRLRQLRAFDGEPAWVRGAFARAPFAVVRRALAEHGVVAVGVRGKSRGERYGTWIEADDVVSTFTPEMLLVAEPLLERRSLPAFIALARLRDALACFGPLIWGPSGSVGFELATQVATVSASSDLDLLIRAPARLPHGEALRILNALDAHAAQAGIRIDAQLETPSGGVALAEYAAGKPTVLARHASGARLVADPWATAPVTPDA